MHHQLQLHVGESLHEEAEDGRKEWQLAAERRK